LRLAILDLGITMGELSPGSPNGVDDRSDCQYAGHGSPEIMGTLLTYNLIRFQMARMVYSLDSIYQSKLIFN